MRHVDVSTRSGDTRADAIKGSPVDWVAVNAAGYLRRTDDRRRVRLLTRAGARPLMVRRAQPSERLPTWPTLVPALLFDA
jgi:hypothetical protein